MSAIAEAVSRRPDATSPHHDVLVVGAGLHGCLATLALLDARPGLRLALIEQGARPAGNHTWCFHGADVPSGVGGWFARLPLLGWPGYRVAFPGFSREVALSYRCLTSDALAEAVETLFAERPRAQLLTGCAVQAVSADSVTLADGRVLYADCVIDARGGAPADHRGGYQKFLGLEVALEADCGLDRPLLMDACLEQGPQFRFMYVLPLAPRRLLIEDTAFALTPALDAAGCREAIAEYAAGRGWRVARVLREESGVLPMPWRGRPAALRVTDLLARHGAGAVPAIQAAWHAQARQFRFGQLLNLLAFRGFRPDLMWHPFARFYRLPLATIERFYGQRSTASDAARLLLGRPPRGFGSAWWGRDRRVRACS